jgi:hypothetical protein
LKACTTAVVLTGRHRPGTADTTDMPRATRRSMPLGPLRPALCPWASPTLPPKRCPSGAYGTVQRWGLSFREREKGVRDANRNK